MNPSPKATNSKKQEIIKLLIEGESNDLISLTTNSTLNYVKSVEKQFINEYRKNAKELISVLSHIKKREVIRIDENEVRWLKKNLKPILDKVCAMEK